MEKTRVAIIGTGNISNAHMEGYNSMPDTVELAACCDIDRDKAEAYAKRYGFPKVYTDYNEMLAEVKPDAVSVCTWNAEHKNAAIAALQEAGSKLSRDMLKSAYRAFAKECYLIIELMRQFYDEERIFRITGKGGESEFVRFSGEVLRARPAKVVGGVELGSREPVFDIVVSAEKKSTFSRLSQNETAKECYQLGFFAPANADAALAALEMMDFEGIEKVRQRVRQNGTLARQLAQMQAQMARLTGLLEAQEQPAPPKLSGPAEELSTAAMARAMKMQKGEVR